MITVPYNYTIDYSHKLSIMDLYSISNYLFNMSQLANAKLLNGHERNSLGLADKIAKILTWDTTIRDELAWMDREPITYGFAVEHVFLDYVKSKPYTGEENLNEKGIVTSRPALYSYFANRRYIEISILSEMVDAGVWNAQQAFDFILLQMKRMMDSFLLEKLYYKYELLGLMCDKITDSQLNAEVFDPTKDYAETKTVNANESSLYYVKQYQTVPTGKTQRYGVIGKPYTANTVQDWEHAVGVPTDNPDTVEKGFIIELSLIKDVPTPGVGATDAEKKQNAANFVRSIRILHDKLRCNSDAYNLAGHMNGGFVVDDMVFLVRAGILAYIDVDLLVGAINPHKATFGFDVIPVSDFGMHDLGAGKHTIGLILHRKAIGLHPKYLSVRERDLAQADRVDRFLHYRFWPVQTLAAPTILIRGIQEIPAEVFKP